MRGHTHYSTYFRPTRQEEEWFNTNSKNKNIEVPTIIILLNHSLINVCITTTFNDDIAHTLDNESSSSILYIIMSYCQFKFIMETIQVYSTYK